MLNRILGKDIAFYVRKQQLLIAFSIILTVIATVFSVIPVALIEPFVDNSMLISGLVLSNEDENKEKALETLLADKTTVARVLEGPDTVEPTKKALETLLEEKTAEPAPKTTEFKIPWITFRSGSIVPIERTELILLGNLSFKWFLVILCIVAFVAMLCKSITSYLSHLAATAFSQRAIRSMRIDLFNKFISLN